MGHYCKFYPFNDEYILYKECSKLVDTVETTIEKYLNEFKPVVHCRIWKNKQKNQIQKTIRFISVFIIE